MNAEQEAFLEQLQRYLLEVDANRPDLVDALAGAMQRQAELGVGVIQRLENQIAVDELHRQFHVNVNIPGRTALGLNDERRHLMIHNGQINAAFQFGAHVASEESEDVQHLRGENRRAVQNGVDRRDEVFANAFLLQKRVHLVDRLVFNHLLQEGERYASHAQPNCTFLLKRVRTCECFHAEQNLVSISKRHAERNLENPFANWTLRAILRDLEELLHHLILQFLQLIGHLFGYHALFFGRMIMQNAEATEQNIQIPIPVLAFV